MSEPESVSAEMGLAFEASIPLTWTVLDSPPGPLEWARMQQRNQETLCVILSLEDYPPEWIEDHASPSPELAHLDFKVNLLLDLVGQLLVRHISLPEPVAIKLTAHELRWQASVVPQVDSCLQVDVYLNLKYPRPVTLIGQMLGNQPLEQGFEAMVRLETLSESLQQAVERLIFRHHRRLVAQSRKLATRGDA